MVIDITNTCRMGCPHCMQRSTIEPQHMDDATFAQARVFARMSGAHVVVLAGGEPTEHPIWDCYLKDLALDGFIVAVATNGMWMGTGKEDRMLSLMEQYEDIRIQLTSVDGLYPLHSHTMLALEKFKQKLKERNLKHRLTFANRIESMVALGRCCDHPELVKLAEANEASTTSCFQGALVSAQVGIREVINELEPRGKFCRPCIDWRGNIHWSESWLCPAFASVNEPFDDICKKAHAWRPCGKCAGYQKLLNKKDEKYMMAKRILGIGNGDVVLGDKTYEEGTK